MELHKMAEYDPTGNGHVHAPVINALANSGCSRGGLLDKLHSSFSDNTQIYKTTDSDFFHRSRFTFNIVGGAGSSSVDHVDTGGAATMARMDGKLTPNTATPHKQWLVRVLKDPENPPPSGFFDIAVHYPELWGRYYDSFVVELGPGDAM